MPTKNDNELTQETIDKAEAFEQMKTDFEEIEKRIDKLVEEKETVSKSLEAMTEQRDKLLDEIEIKDDRIEEQTREIEALKEAIESGEAVSGESGVASKIAEFDEEKFDEYSKIFISAEIASSQYGRTAMKLVHHVTNNESSLVATNSVGAKDEIVFSGTVATVLEKAVEIMKTDFSYISEVVRGEIKYSKGFSPSL